jgi:hypothetical protein
MQFAIGQNKIDDLTKVWEMEGISKHQPYSLRPI